MATSPVPRSFGRKATTARQRKAIDLLANGLTAEQAAQELGGITVNGVRKLWNRALAAQAADLRDADAYERGLTVVMLRLEKMLAAWMPKALALDKDAADIALRTIGLVMKVCGYDTQGSRPQRDDGDGPGDNAGEVLPESAIKAILDRLEVTAGKLNAPETIVIAGEIVDEHEGPTDIPEPTEIPEPEQEKQQ